MVERSPYWPAEYAAAVRSLYNSVDSTLTFTAVSGQDGADRTGRVVDFIPSSLGLDFVRVQLEAGSSYDFRSSGSGGTLELTILDSSGYLLLHYDSDGNFGSAMSTLLDFVPDYSGTYYLGFAFTGTNSGSYEVTGVQDVYADGINGPPPRLNVYPVPTQRTEGDQNATDFHVTIERSGTLSGTTTATWRVSGQGSQPTDAWDFITNGGQVTFAPGESSKVVTIRVAGDLTVEPNETFVFTLSNASGGAQIGNATVAGTIFDDDSNPTYVSLAPLSTDYAEGSDGGATTHSFLVQRTSGVGSVQFSWLVQNFSYTGVDASDFVGNVLPSGLVTFAEGETQKLVTLQLRADREAETDETYSFRLLDLPSGYRFSNSSAEITVRDDDFPLAQLAIGVDQDSVAEGTGGGVRVITFTVTRSGDLSLASTAAWRVVTEAGGAGAADFLGGVLPSGTVSFAAGEATQTIKVRVQRDAEIEADERFGVVLESPSHRTSLSADSQVWTTVLDDDEPETAPPPTQIITIEALEPDGVLEGTGGGTTIHQFRVTRSHADTPTPTLSWTVSPGGANSADGWDFAFDTTPSGTITFEEGELSRLIQFEVLQDDSVEPDETFQVGFTSLPAGVVFANTSATGIILTDDVEPTVFTIAGAPSRQVLEGTGAGWTPVTFVIVRDQASGTDQVTWSILTGFQDSAGYANSSVADFAPGQAMSGVATFNPGETEFTVTVHIAKDSLDEQDEGFFLELNDGQPLPGVGTVAAHVAILDDDQPPALLDIAATIPARTEGTSSGLTVHEFVVTRSGNLDIAATARWSVQGEGDQPANAADFLGGVVPGGTVSFAAGEVSQIIKVRTLRDGTAEQDESFRVTLHDAGDGVVLSDASASVTLLDDDTQRDSYAITPASSSRAEGTGSGVTVHEFTVTREGELSATQLAWSVAGTGPAAADAADFLGGVLPSGTISFAEGQDSQVVKVRVLRDATVEVDEAFALTLRAPGGQVLATADATIGNDDAPPPAFTASLASTAASRAEGTGTGVTVYEYTVTRSGTLSAAELSWSATGSGPAAANAADFMGNVLPSGTISFAEGQESQVLKVRVQRDATLEADEAFAITLRGPGGQVLATASGAILNDDAPPFSYAIAPGSLSQAEGTGSGVTVHSFTVTRQGDLSLASTTNWSVAGFGEDAADASDFLNGLLPGGTLAFAAGEASQVVKVRVLRDGLAEADEGYVLRLPGASATGLILDDDTARLATAQADLQLLG
ncbi:Calx-beta domain-containing protein [Falsiroseomonas sp.]|uniref:Calx-beta domain-containing protein n=1 Tax=Falsiroseomonas sp. TaxID=2870721 RepID=UPI003F6FD072